MDKFLFRFGYCTPAQWVTNLEHNWDGECSGACLISANSESEALQTGCEIAENFVQYLFAKEGYADIPSWKESLFAFWIEQNPNDAFNQNELNAIPEVIAGEEDFSNWCSTFVQKYGPGETLLPKR